MSRKLNVVLDDCMDLLRTGASVDDCLSRYPEHADELRPLISLAAAVRNVPTPLPDPVSVESHRLQMLDAVRGSGALNHRRGSAVLGSVWRLSTGLRSRPLLRTGLKLAVMLLLIGLASGALFLSAAGSLPGQTLYPVKRFGENIRLSLTLDPAQQQQLRTEYRFERQREVRQVLEAGQRAVLEFRGELQEIGEGFWVVGGLKVTLDSNTSVQGQSVIGAMVIVQASSPGDGTLRAAKLQALSDPMLLTPVATATPSWTSTSSSTPSAWSTSTATPVVTSTPSSVPTATYAISPVPTETPPPVATPTMTASPWPTATPTPGETEEPEATDYPDGDETDEPEPTVDADD